MLDDSPAFDERDFFTFETGSGPVQRAQDGAHRRKLNVRVHARAPAGFAIGVLDLDVGDGHGFLAGTQGMLAVGCDFESRAARLAESMYERRKRTIAFAGQFDGFAVAQ
jgi:hypothetical protein